MPDTSLDNAVEQYIRTIIRDEVDNGDGNGNGNGGDTGDDIDLDALADKVSDRIEIDVDHPDQLGEDQVRAWIEEYPHRSDDEIIALIDEHADGSGDGDGLTDDEREQLRTLLDRIDGSLDAIGDELGITMTIGPEVPDENYMHNTAGWGQAISVNEPVRFGECDIVSATSSTFEAELWRYQNGDTQDRVDATEIQTPSDGEHHVDLDLVAPEQGIYLLTRDYQAQPDSPADLARPAETYDYPESGELLTVETGAHNEYNDSSYWYYYYSLTVEAHDPDGG